MRRGCAVSPLGFDIKIRSIAPANGDLRKKTEKSHNECCGFFVGADLFFRDVAIRVFSARISLTTVFGMGTGVP